ncbi:hypothetical protein WR25_17610 [Diploscapter pachys]|uniref:Uncharacterized protein n=1 Tax=Diploscapter pachys TaxID=2018661 RepID=A0A2A2K6E9_9BILA|nr:hypothetical protein WR25_17610 [Diploscapter pachys]
MMGEGVSVWARTGRDADAARFARLVEVDQLVKAQSGEPVADPPHRRDQIGHRTHVQHDRRAGGEVVVMFDTGAMPRQIADAALARSTIGGHHDGADNDAVALFARGFGYRFHGVRGSI